MGFFSGVSHMLTPSQVHIWQAHLDREMTPEHRAMLSPDELTRADRFRFDKDRHHFIIARSLLRTILAQYLEIAPAQVAFDYSAKGKPFIQNQPLFFNVSHSHNMAVYAIALNRVGIDIEHLRAIDAIPLAQRFFSASESQFLQSLTGESLQRTFFRGWTQKEAYLKATGDGLVGLESVEVALEPPMALIQVPDEALWFVQEIEIPDYMAALVVEGKSFEIKAFSI